MVTDLAERVTEAVEGEAAEEMEPTDLVVTDLVVTDLAAAVAAVVEAKMPEVVEKETRAIMPVAVRVLLGRLHKRY